MIKKISFFFASILLSASSLFVLVPQKVLAAASGQTCTWDGSASANWSNAENWSCSSGGPGSAAVPSAGDDLIFPYGAGITRKTPNNDLTAGTSFYSLTFSGTPATNEPSYTITGNQIALEHGIDLTSSSAIYPDIDLNINFSADQSINITSGSISLSGILSGTGNINQTGGYVNLFGNNTFSGSYNISSASNVGAYTVTALGSSSGSTTIANGGYLGYLISTESAYTISEPFIINNNDAIYFRDRCFSASLPCPDLNATLSGSITLGTDTYISIPTNPGTVTVTGSLSGAHTLKINPSSIGRLVINSSNNTSGTSNGSQGQIVQTITYSANSQSTDLSIGKNTTAIVTGTYGYADVFSGGILKGTGTLSNGINIRTGGILAPGTSPGCLTSGDLAIAGEYQAELQGTTACSSFDQIKVSGAVSLLSDSSVLAVSLTNKYTPKVGDAFKIIDNDAADAVTGTFKALPEGTTFKVSGYVMKISYKGGDGNDVVLTVQSVPSVPETGLLFVKNNPLLTLTVSMIAAASIYGISRKLKPAKK